jgi:fructose-1,6-bisphosphatase/inositol monophosphatase family enzyme
VNITNPQSVVDRLIDFQRRVRQLLIDARQSTDLHNVSRDSAADTIYAIDELVEPMLEDFCRDWAKTTPLILIAEGIEDENGIEGFKTYPQGTAEADTQIRLIVDPIDGTRGIMFDKRPAWALAGVAPNKGPATRLSDIQVSVMTELPTSKMGHADVLWAIKGHGAHARRDDLTTGATRELKFHPSPATTISHNFAMVFNAFPGTRVKGAELMEHLIAHLIPPADIPRATVFDDQYISTGGQFYELLVGHDVFNADVRPQLFQMQSLPIGMCCHPYDCAAWLVPHEAGVILTDGAGAPLDGPLDVTTPISWAGYANRTLHDKIQPLLTRWLESQQK